MAEYVISDMYVQFQREYFFTLLYYSFLNKIPCFLKIIFGVSVCAVGPLNLIMI